MLPKGLGEYIRGDANGDGSIDIGDGIATLAYLFGDGSSLCQDAMDHDDSGSISITDAFLSLCWLFCLEEGSPPAAPWPDCGGDPTGGDALGCGVPGALCP